LPLKLAASGAQDLDPELTASDRDLRDQAALPNTWLSKDSDEHAVPRPGALQKTLKPLQLAFPLQKLVPQADHATSPGLKPTAATATNCPALLAPR
jgi:hypothetical protein